MNYYELTCLLPPVISEEKAQIITEKIKNFIEEEGGRVEKTTPVLKKKLAYQFRGKQLDQTGLKNIDETFLIVLDFSLNPEKIKSLEKKLKDENQIIRYLLLSKKPLNKSNLKTKKPTEKPEEADSRPKNKKVELKEIDKKIEEILKE